jgi:hypothetical protein
LNGQQRRGGGVGRGIGNARGQGRRGNSDDNIKFYDTQTKPDAKLGPASKVGTMGGPNRKGVTQAEIQEAIREAAESKDLTPNDLQDIPVNQREHVRQYFQKLRQK